MDGKTKLEQYAEIQSLVQKEISTQFPMLLKEYEAQYGVAKNVPLHYHTGQDSPQIASSSILPGFRASGSITMATNATTYTLGTPFNPTAVMFYGVAVHSTAGTVDIRATVVGDAQLGKSYYFQPGTAPFSVNASGPVQPFVQSSSAVLFDSSTTPITIRTTVSEGHLVSVEYPSGTVVARATITAFGPKSILVLTSLAANWQIVGNFVVT